MTTLLQKKFVTTAMIAITALIVVMVAAINISNLISSESQIAKTMNLLSKYDGDRTNIPDSPVPSNEPQGNDQDRRNKLLTVKPKPNEEDTFLSNSFFFLRLNSNNIPIYVNTDQISYVDNDDALQFADTALKSGKSSGVIGSYRFSITDNNYMPGKTIVFLDSSEFTKGVINILLISLGVGIICWLIMFGIMCLLSKKAIRPIAENIERQKQFITNAGHELKTPLAIILSNTEAMELYNGENKWTNNIKFQTTRLSELTRHLLTLAKMDESIKPGSMESFSLSEVITDEIAAFSEAFAMNNISVTSDIPKNVYITGDRSQIKELISILLDNASKYTRSGGTFSVSLSNGEKKALVNMSNTCSRLPEVPAEKLFERFYRCDNARTQKTGGHGIGLSVASSIVSNHNGRITAKYTKPDIISFQVIL